MPAHNVKLMSKTKRKMLTTSNLSSELKESVKRLENLLVGYSAKEKAGKSYAKTVTKKRQGKKMSTEEAYKEKQAKIRPSLLPVEAIVEGIKAMEYGAIKYGTDQWKTVNMEPRQFMDALERHLIALKQGETHASDSGVHHLGHIIANCGILLSRFRGGIR